MLLETMEKHYVDIGWGENLWDAICKSADRENPKVINKWIESQAEAYMDSEYDTDRINIILWKMKSLAFLDILKMHDCDSDTKSETGLNDIKQVVSIEKNNQKIQDLYNEFLRLFEKDKETERREWAYEIASQDYDIFSMDIKKDDDEDVAQFFNITRHVDMVRENGEEHDLSEVEFCTHCNHFQVMNEMTKEYNNEDEKELESDYFYCGHCGELYKYDDKHIKLNSHKKPEEILARCV